MEKRLKYPVIGFLLAILILCFWTSHLLYCLTLVDVAWSNPWMYFHLIIQGYLCTGLFITAHDAMHGTIHTSKKVNRFFGSAASFLFAGFSYTYLKEKHILHHKHPGTESDPDFNTESQNFWKWWAKFMLHYMNRKQILFVISQFLVLVYFYSFHSIAVFWLIPPFLGSLQLFYFGTYLPHKYPHLNDMDPHKARTQKKNHIWGMLSCYFFGYHFEHHEYPWTPWWQLYRVKNEITNKNKSQP